MKNSRPLQSSLNQFKADWETRVGADIARLIADDIDYVRASGILDRAARAGAAFPKAVLTDATGKSFDLSVVYAKGPAIVIFYRGGWCPYCNLELRSYQKMLGDIHAAGGALVAISPELPDHSLTTAQKNELAFPILSDHGSALAADLGIRFSLSEAVRPFYEKAGHTLPDRNGDGAWVLPMPATFVVAKGGRIAAAFIEPDYRKRTDPAEAVTVLRTLSAARAV